MRLVIYISTDVLSPRKRHGTYHARWMGYGDSGRLLGEDGTMDSEYGNQYGLLIRALREAAAHINQNARPEVVICCSTGIMIQAIKNLKTWEQRDFKKRNGQPLAYADDWRFIAKKLEGLYFSVKGGRGDGTQ